MPQTALPAATTATSASATEGDVKNWLTQVHDFLAFLLGTSGSQADARTALGISSDANTLEGHPASYFSQASHAHSGYMPTDVGIAGIGTIGMLSSSSGSPVTSGSTVAGSSLRFVTMTDAPLLATPGSAPSGTWRNITSDSVLVGAIGMFQRIV